MKKFLFLTVLAVMLSLGVYASAAGIVDSGAYAGDFKYVLDTEGHLVISGTGNMQDYYIDDRPPWHLYKSQIEKVTVANGITNIANSAFSDCEILETITIPRSVTTIGNGALSRCSSLVEIKVDAGNANYYSVDGVLFERGTNTLVKYPSAKSNTEYEIPYGVTAIGDNAFWMCRKLGTIVVPTTVNKIGNGAFWLCSTLRNVEIPESVTYIGDAAFSGCSWLTTIEIPNSVTTIGNKAFSNCSWMTSITIPDTVTNLGNGLFFNCSRLEKINLPTNITAVGDSLFLNCTKLVDVTIPEGVTSIGDSAFYGCSGLSRVTIPDSVTSIEDSAFYGCKSLSVINYRGSEAEWKKITDRSGIKSNEAILVNYNSEAVADDIVVPVVDNDAITVNYNSEPIAFDQPPVAQNGRTLVPFRAICEAMGAEVGWDGETQTMTATLDDITLVFTVGEATVMVNGEEKALDQPPVVINERALLPARAFAEELGGTVEWDGNTKTVDIYK